MKTTTITIAEDSDAPNDLWSVTVDGVLEATGKELTFNGALGVAVAEAILLRMPQEDRPSSGRIPAARKIMQAMPVPPPPPVPEQLFGLRVQMHGTPVADAPPYRDIFRDREGNLRCRRCYIMKNQMHSDGSHVNGRGEPCVAGAQRAPHYDEPARCCRCDSKAWMQYGVCTRADGSAAMDWMCVACNVQQDPDNEYGHALPEVKS